MWAQKCTPCPRSIRYNAPINVKPAGGEGGGRRRQGMGWGFDITAHAWNVEVGKNVFGLSLFRPSRQSNISTSGEERFKYPLPWENKISQMPYPRANKDNQIPTPCPACPRRRHNIDRCITSSIIKHGRSSARSAIARSFEMKGSRVLANLVYSWQRYIVRCVIYPPFCSPLVLKEKSCSVLPNTNSWNLLELAIRPFFLSHP